MQFSNTFYNDKKDSSFRTSFYSKCTYFTYAVQISRPTTEQRQRNAETVAYMWLKKPINYEDLVKSSKGNFLVKKNVIENNSLVMGDDELVSLLDIWTMNIR
jgi:hypothetical protein